MQLKVLDYKLQQNSKNHQKYKNIKIEHMTFDRNENTRQKHWERRHFKISAVLQKSWTCFHEGVCEVRVWGQVDVYQCVFLFGSLALLTSLHTDSLFLCELSQAWLLIWSACRYVHDASAEWRHHPWWCHRSTNGSLIWLWPLGEFTQLWQWGQLYDQTSNLFCGVKSSSLLCDKNIFSGFLLKVELGFRSGDIIYVLGDMDQDGFYFVSLTFTIKTQHLLCASPTEFIFILFQGDLHGRRGLVPSNYLQLLPWD